MHGGEHDSRGRAEEGRAVLVREGLDGKRILDREEGQLRAQLRARGPEVAEEFDDLARSPSVVMLQPRESWRTNLLDLELLVGLGDECARGLHDELGELWEGVALLQPRLLRAHEGSLGKGRPEVPTW